LVGYRTVGGLDRAYEYFVQGWLIGMVLLPDQNGQVELAHDGVSHDPCRYGTGDFPSVLAAHPIGQDKDPEPGYCAVIALLGCEDQRCILIVVAYLTDISGPPDLKSGLGRWNRW
jgi:hypothetical protein